MKEAVVTSDETPITSVKASERFLNGLHIPILEMVLKFVNDKMAPVNG